MNIAMKIGVTKQIASIGRVMAHQPAQAPYDPMRELRRKGLLRLQNVPYAGPCDCCVASSGERRLRTIGE